MGSAQRLVGVIQARMGSTRLPGKALADLGGRPVLEWVIEGARLASLCPDAVGAGTPAPLGRRCPSQREGRASRRAQGLEEVVVATTRAPEDAAIIACAQACGAAVFAGSSDDVLGRVLEAARWRRAAVVVRLTGDCPFLDPEIIAAVLERHVAAGADLTTNDAALGGHPRGFDVEAVEVAVLEHANSLARKPQHREHVTAFLLERAEDYRIEVVPAPPELRRPYRLCVDTAEDLRLCREIAARLGPARPDAAAIIALLDAEPALAAINPGTAQQPVEANRG